MPEFIVTLTEREAAANHAADLDRAARFLRWYSDMASWEESRTSYEQAAQQELLAKNARIEELESEIILQRKILRDARKLAFATIDIDAGDHPYLTSAAQNLIRRIDTEQPDYSAHSPDSTPLTAEQKQHAQWLSYKTCCTTPAACCPDCHTTD